MGDTAKAQPILEEAYSILEEENGSFIARIGYYNLILLATAYGKVNTPEDGIRILTELLAEPINDY